MLAAGLDRLLVPQAEHAQPPAEIAAAVAPGRTVVRPDGKIDLAAGALEFIGDLHPGRPRADHQDGALGQLPGVAVIGRMDLRERGVPRRDGRDHRPLERPGRDNDALRLVGAGRRLHRKAVPAAIALGAHHFHAGTDGRIELARISLQVVGHGVLGRETVRIEPFEFQAGEAIVPGGAVRHQGVPPPGSPALRDAVTLQHDVRHSLPSQVLAHRDARLATADDEGVGQNGAINSHVFSVIDVKGFMPWARGEWETAQRRHRHRGATTCTRWLGSITAKKARALRWIY
ncbi:Uncharacterised protein [Bordetella pertussis]|nr:Uncharacterised protein [Bordetella pertussis]